MKENGQENKFVQILVSTFDSGLSFIGKKNIANLSIATRNLVNICFQMAVYCIELWKFQ